MNMQQRKSHTALSKIYFWTAIIHNWYHLLENDFEKEILIGSLKNLSSRKLITVYAFVIMPNHIHLIWQLNKLNGKESAKGSFMKYTAHEFKKRLKLKAATGEYKVETSNKTYEIWQSDSLGIEIWSREVARQKLDYVHANLISGKWLLAKDDLSY